MDPVSAIRFNPLSTQDKNIMVERIDKLDTKKHSEKEFLKAILGMLTKIYWEARKPKT